MILVDDIRRARAFEEDAAHLHSRADAWRDCGRFYEARLGHAAACRAYQQARDAYWRVAAVAAIAAGVVLALLLALATLAVAVCA